MVAPKSVEQQVAEKFVKAINAMTPEQRQELKDSNGLPPMKLSRNEMKAVKGGGLFGDFLRSMGAKGRFENCSSGEDCAFGYRWASKS